MMKRAIPYACALLLGVCTFVTDQPAFAQEPMLGEIRMVGFSFCPRGWAAADGQLLPINQNTALFSLLGTTYGGDGRSTFALPDLRGRVPVHAGQGGGLSDYRQGAKGGSEQNTLTTSNLPPHQHSIQGVSSGSGNSTGVLIGKGSGTQTATTNQVGSGQAVNNLSPYLTIRYCVALQGIFPSRN